MQDNTSNVKRLLLSLKITVVLFLIITIEDLLTIGNPEPKSDVAVVLYFVLGFIFFIAIIAACISRLFWLLWIFRAEENLRKIATTTFSPWIAVFFSICPVMDVFILRDIIQNTERQLDAKQPHISTVPINLKPVNIAFAFLAARICYVFIPCSTPLDTTFTLIILVNILICLVRTIEPFQKKERQLFQICENEILNKKVDEILRNRKIEEAARMVQEAKFE